MDFECIILFPNNTALFLNLPDAWNTPPASTRLIFDSITWPDSLSRNIQTTQIWHQCLSRYSLDEAVRFRFHAVGNRKSYDNHTHSALLQANSVLLDSHETVKAI